MKHKKIADKYKEEVLPQLIKEFGLGNAMAAPRIKKIVVNMGTGDRLRNKETKERLLSDMALLTGQAPKVQSARLSISGFSLRQGMPVGLTVTLRRDRMYNFLDKVISVVLPRIRDFRGVSKTSFDGAGNYTLGFSEHTVFPEIDIAKVDRPQGLEMSVVFENSSKEKSFRLLELMGMPFEKNT